MKIRQIAYYLRNSTDIQDYQYQLENLDKRFNQFRDVNKLIYAEKISGFKSEKERPLMNQLLTDVDSGLISEIWVNDVTRLSRDAINMQIIVKHCQDKGVNIYFDEQNLNTLDNQGNADFTTTLLINILGQFAEANAKNFKSKGKQGKITKSKQGRYVGGLLPYGYSYQMDSKNKEIIINEEQKRIVEYMFDCYANQNKSLAQIANEFNNQKKINSDYNNKFEIFNLSDNSIWRGSTIRHILKCTWYSLGKAQFGGETFPIKEELKFIDIDLFNKVQDKLITNKNNVKPHKHSYILNNLIYCDCGSKMYTRTNNERQTYICGEIMRRESDKTINCKVGKQTQIEQVENAVWLLVKNKLKDFQIEIGKKSDRTNEINEQIEQNNLLIASIKTKTIENLKLQRQRTIDTFNRFGGAVDKLEFDIKTIDNQIKNEDKNIQKIKSDNKLLEMSIKNLDITTEIQKNIEAIEADKNLIKYYCEKLINKVVALGIKSTNTNVYRIIWNAEINNNIDTYLFHNTRLYQRPNYYFLNSTESTNIQWNSENKTFVIIENNQYIEKSIEDIELILNRLYSENIEKNYPKFIYYNYNLVLESQFKTTDNDFKELSIVDKLNTNTMDFQPLFPINMGVGKLEIVTPFK